MPLQDGDGLVRAMGWKSHRANFDRKGICEVRRGERRVVPEGDEVQAEIEIESQRGRKRLRASVAKRDGVLADRNLETASG